MMTLKSPPPPNNSDTELLCAYDLRKSVNDLSKTVQQLQEDSQILKKLQLRGNLDAAEVPPVAGPPGPLGEAVEPYIVNNDN